MPPKKRTGLQHLKAARHITQPRKTNITAARAPNAWRKFGLSFFIARGNGFKTCAPLLSRRYCFLKRKGVSPLHKYYARLCTRLTLTEASGDCRFNRLIKNSNVIFPARALSLRRQEKASYAANLFCSSNTLKHRHAVEPLGPRNIIESSVPRERCIGCGLCVAVCPEDCIQIAENKDGELKPAAAQRCLSECGECLQVCPFNEANEQSAVIADKLYASLGTSNYHPEIAYAAASRTALLIVPADSRQALMQPSCIAAEALYCTKSYPSCLAISGCLNIFRLSSRIARSRRGKLAGYPISSKN